MINKLQWLCKWQHVVVSLLLRYITINGQLTVTNGWTTAVVTLLVSVINHRSHTNAGALLLARLMGQYCFAGWRLLSVMLPAGGRAGRRACGRSGGWHCTAGQYGYVLLARHLVFLQEQYLGTWHSHWVNYSGHQYTEESCLRSCLSVWCRYTALNGKMLQDVI